MVIVEERNDIQPICPHCSKALQRILSNEVKTFLGKRYIYFCPECRKVLGISHRKGIFTS